MHKSLLFLLAFIFTAFSMAAQVVVNEYSASNLNSFIDSFGKTEDWIELANVGTTDVDISGWYISDKVDNPTKYQIPSGTIIPANGFLVFSCSGRDQFVNGEYHTNFKLTQTKPGDGIVLSNAAGSVLQTIDLELTLVEHSRCRELDGAATWKVCTEPTYGTSNITSPKYSGYTATPSMDLAAGYYQGTQSVSIINNEPNSVVRWTANGHNPTENSTEYTIPANVISTKVIKAQAYSNDPDILPGKIEFNTYFIDEDFTLAVFSVGAEDVIELANGDGDLIPIGSLEYFNVDKEREATSFGSLNRHGQDSWALPHRSLDWISRDEMGYSKAVDAPIFSYSDRDEYQKFMFRNSGDDNYPAVNDADHEGSCHIRDEYVQELSRVGGMKLDTRAVERVILFLNGNYWGVYGMRERPVDHDYTDEYYDQGKYDIQYLSTWGDTEIEYGGQAALSEWRGIRDFILENDMSIPENYELATDSINMLSMIDYMIVNLTVVASDWMNYNTGWWRGRNPEGDHKKWGYILWDLDATFDYYINYSGVPNTDPDAVPCDLEVIGDFMDDFFPPEGDINPAECPTVISGECPYPADDEILSVVFEFEEDCCYNNWGADCQDTYNWLENNGIPAWAGGIQGNVGKHEKLFLKLLEENPTFKQLYYSRYADMMNTVYSCENMIETLDQMIAVIEPEMPRQIERWGGTMGEWESNVQDLKDFINARCTMLDDGMLECYDELTGPYNITLMTEPEGVAEIDFNTLDIEAFPWTGDYFGGMENLIKTKLFNQFEDQYVFSHWESSAGNIIFPDETSDEGTITLTASDTLTAVYADPTSIDNTLADFDFKVFPNPAKNFLTVDFELEASMNIHISMHSAIGKEMLDFESLSGNYSAGNHTTTLSFEDYNIPSGLYYVVVNFDDTQRSYKVNIMR